MCSEIFLRVKRSQKSKNLMLVLENKLIALTLSKQEKLTCRTTKPCFSQIKDVDQSVFGDLGLFGAEFLEKLLTEILQLGIKIPSMKGVALKSPRLDFFLISFLLKYFTYSSYSIVH